MPGYHLKNYYTYSFNHAALLHARGLRIKELRKQKFALNGEEKERIEYVLRDPHNGAAGIVAGYLNGGMVEARQHDLSRKLIGHLTAKLLRSDVDTLAVPPKEGRSDVEKNRMARIAAKKNALARQPLPAMASAYLNEGEL